MMSFTKRFGIGMAGLLAFGVCAAEDLPFKEGTVTEVSSVKIKEGHFLDYMTYLDTSYKQIMDEAKKQGLIVSYAVYGARPKTPQEPDLYLIIEYANLAALDGITR